jgi:hypothetical protein
MDEQPDGIIPAAQRDGLTERPPPRARLASPPEAGVRSVTLRRGLLAVCQVLLLVAAALLVVWVILAPGVYLEFISLPTPSAAAPPAGTFWAEWGLPALLLTLAVATLALAAWLLRQPWRDQE